MKPKKGQMSFEFIAIFIGILILFLVILTLVAEKNKSINNYKLYLEAKEIAEEGSSGINQVYLGGHGMKKKIYIPTTLSGGMNYDLFVVENMVEIRWQNHHYSSKTITSNITGVFSNGENNITNIEGEIQIE